ncbi:MAG: carboxypeptidase-like regulatory domain-containing protein [Kofleriaceae bacterium]
MRRVAALVLAGWACGGAQPKLFPAGTDKDEGHGNLARASAKFMTTEGGEEDLFASSSSSSRRPRRYGGTTYGGGMYGGASYANFVVSQWAYQPANRATKYNQIPGLSGAVEGVVSWRGAIPNKRITACGAIEGVHVGPDRGIADVVVYIEKITTGRAMPTEGRPASVGGVVVKRNCALVPTAQIVTPLPAALSIHGDAKRAKLKVTTPPGPVVNVELQEGGRAAMQVQAGITRIDSDDGSLAAAWVLALETPYYAITDDTGHFRIDELAPGTYEVTIWQAPLPDDGTGAIKYGAPVIQRRTVRVEATRVAKLDVVLGR